MPKVEERVVIGSAQDLQYHFDSLLPALHLTETEDSWQKIEKSLVKLEVITKSGGYKYDGFPLLFKSVAQPIINSLLSERTKLSGTAADLLNSVAPRLAERFEALVHVFAPPLLLICARTNKVALVRAKKCLLLIAKHCKLPSLLPHLREGAKDKSQTLRMVSVEVTLMLLEAIECREKIGRRVADLEVIVRGTATDRDPEVRQWCKRVFEVYVDRWPERVLVFTASFTPTTRRYLALPKNGAAMGPAQPTRAPPSPTRRADSGASRRHKAPLSTTLGHAGPAPSAVSSASPLPPMRALFRVQGTPSSRIGSGESSSAGGAVHSSSSDAIGDAGEEQRRAALRAELIKKTTGTPSQGIAARLALEQFEHQVKRKSAQRAGAGGEGASAEGTDRSAFAIAMSKKQSPRKGPIRIPVAPPPTLRKVSSDMATATETMRKPAQRLISTAVAKGKAKAASTPSGEGDENEDVFRSRPIWDVKAPAATTSTTAKTTSSISRSLGARVKLLGPSAGVAAGGGGASNRAKAAANSRCGGQQTVKRSMATSRLKVDIGKENIPPGSQLEAIAAGLPPFHEHRSRPAPKAILAEAAPPVDCDSTKAGAMAAAPAEEVVGAPFTADARSDTSSVTQDAVENVVVVGQDAVSHTPEEGLEDWSKVALSLAQDVSLPVCKSAGTSTASSQQPGPSMSTPVRKPLGSLQDNKPLSSPLEPLSKPVPQTFTLAPEPQRTAASTVRSRTVLLAPSRKM